MKLSSDHMTAVTTGRPSHSDAFAGFAFVVQQLAVNLVVVPSVQCLYTDR
jgi:hypothetical protein